MYLADKFDEFHKMGNSLFLLVVFKITERVLIGEWATVLKHRMVTFNTLMNPKNSITNQHKIQCLEQPLNQIQMQNNKVLPNKL